MERMKVEAAPSAAYPDLRAFVRRYQRRAGVGLVLTAVGTSGCIFPFRTIGDMAVPDTADSYAILGDMAETGEVRTVLLPDAGSHELRFEAPWGRIAYRLQLLVEDWTAADWLAQNADAALETSDQVLAAHQIYELQPGQDLTALEAEIAQALAEIMGDDVSVFADIMLLIDDYEEVHEIDGDAG